MQWNSNTCAISSTLFCQKQSCMWTWNAASVYHCWRKYSLDYLTGVKWLGILGPHLIPWMKQVLALIFVCKYRRWLATRINARIPANSKTLKWFIFIFSVLKNNFWMFLDCLHSLNFGLNNCWTYHIRTTFYNKFNQFNMIHGYAPLDRTLSSPSLQYQGEAIILLSFSLKCIKIFLFFSFPASFLSICLINKLPDRPHDMTIFSIWWNVMNKNQPVQNTISQIRTLKSTNNDCL